MTVRQFFDKLARMETVAEADRPPASLVIPSAEGRLAPHGAIGEGRPVPVPAESAERIRAMRATAA